MHTSTLPQALPGSTASARRGPVSISSHEIGHEEVEVRLYEGPVSGHWSAIVCRNWQVLALASGYASADVIETALDKAREKLSAG